MLVACTLVVMTLLRTVNDTVPTQAPAMVFYDIQPDQIAVLNDVLKQSTGLAEVKAAPFVVGRLIGVNGEELLNSEDIERLRESRDEHKLSDKRGNFDDVVLERGQWWALTTRAHPRWRWKIGRPMSSGSLLVIA